MSTEYFRLERPIVSTKSADGLQWRAQLLIFLVAVLAVVSRRPDAIFHPQFFAEDGVFWYSDAYNLGWLHALLIPANGYFQTLPRLAAAFSLLLPLQFAPLLLNVIAIIVQVLPITFLLSSRCSRWGPLKLRYLMAVAYVALPNSSELDAVITEAQWHLALLASLIVLSVPSTRRAWRLFDVLITLLSGLTGPFCLVLFPIAGVVYWKRRAMWHLVIAVLLAGCTAVQFIALATTTSATRIQETLGATPSLFLRMLSGDVYLGAMLGQNHFASRASLWLLLLVGVLASAIVVYCFLRANLEFKLFLVYSFLLYAASLHNPMISDDKPQWPILESASGIRYWFFPMLAFVWAAIWCVGSRPSKPFRAIAGPALALMIFGGLKDWRYPAFSTHDFAAYARKFEGAPAGTVMFFPIYPDGWTMRLVKNANCQARPFGVIDQPKKNALISGLVPLAGWVNASQPVKNVSVSLDRALKQSFPPGILRPDVDQKFPGSPVKEKGWRTTLDLSAAAPGTHVIQVSAQLQNGCEAIIGTVPLQTTH
jgi:hypothetical protein